MGKPYRASAFGQKSWADQVSTDCPGCPTKSALEEVEWADCELEVFGKLLAATGLLAEVSMYSLQQIDEFFNAPWVWYARSSEVDLGLFLVISQRSLPNLLQLRIRHDAGALARAEALS